MSEQQTRICSTAVVTTPQAARYLSQLCKHFQHKVPVALGGQPGQIASGQIAFSMGDCRLTAVHETLTLSAEAADSAQLAQVQDVVARHLLRFAFREELRVDWRRV